VNCLELDELWSYVGKKQRRVKPDDSADLGDQYVFIGIDATRKAIISYRIGKRDGENTNEFLADLRQRVVNTLKSRLMAGRLILMRSSALSAWTAHLLRSSSSTKASRRSTRRVATHPAS
jgi:hypothetical protein